MTTHLSTSTRFLAAALSLLVCCVPALAADDAPHAHAALQQQLDEALPGAVVDFGHRDFVTLDTPLHVTKSVWIRNLKLRLPAKLPKTPLLVATAPGVQITDSHFIGNGDSVTQDERASLVEIRAGNFRVERCVFENSAKNGLTIDPGNSGEEIVGGVVRDIVGHKVIRDVVSISGATQHAFVRDVLVENVRASDSSLRGAVEVSDCSREITVRGVTAERCVYAIDVQDHEAGDVNYNVLLEDIRARHCRHAIRTATDPLGHAGLTIRNVVAEHCDVPLRLSYFTDLVVDGVRIVGHQRDAAEPEDLACVVQVKGCTNVSLRDFAISDVGTLPTAVHVIDTHGLRAEGIAVQGSSSLESVVLFERRKSTGQQHADDQPVLRNIVAPSKSVPEAKFTAN